MRFIYHEKSGADTLRLDKEQYNHIFKVRRENAQKPLFFCNLKDKNIYTYKVLQIDKKSALCELVEAQKVSIADQKEFQIAWSVIDPKIIEKTLPFLNEVGLKKLIFVYTKFSQHNFKIDFERFRRIIINSCEQCGRANLMEFEIFNSLEEFLKAHSDIAVVDFSSDKFGNFLGVLPKIWLVGNEGGFDESEREQLSRFARVGFECENVLRSSSAVMAIASKLLL
ncbi:MAG: 16S rRNA (uracil(1498)-N(3))-methyltransferase [Campylobacteraceae bacterium]|jgi:16S rRNA (uracil1498-N3)-methyltransferase|nr:16S rRNA (uracil(1498)-N(3))-methyltransferase [Campylobacteraceae bacterium]